MPQRLSSNPKRPYAAFVSLGETLRSGADPHTNATNTGAGSVCAPREMTMPTGSCGVVSGVSFIYRKGCTSD